VAVVRRDYGFRDADAKSVIVNGIAMTATVKPVWRYMAAEGHLPALFAPNPSRGLVICVGTGITLSALASEESVTSIDAVDLSESVLAALPVFERENRRVYRDPKVNVVHADGRHVLELSDGRYGLITLEPPPPIVAGSVHLYTLDFYRLCRSRLEPGGVVAQWLPLHAQSLASAQATARTFLEAFPFVQLWLPSIRDAVLIGSDRPLRLDPERVRAAYATPATRASLDAAYFESPEALLATFLLDREGVARWSAGADLITDDRPRIEFFRRYGATMPDREIATLLAPPLPGLDEILGKNPDPAFRSAVEAERRAHLLYLQAEIDKDPARSRDAALASRATRFGLYRLGCDEPQLDALRADPAGLAQWRKQADMCRGWIEESSRSN
jgi:spermidine synthase